jgi:hypothetical protein
MASIPTFFAFWPFWGKNFTNMPLLERFRKMDPKLGAVNHGAEIARLGAKIRGVEVHSCSDKRDNNRLTWR